MLYVLMGHFLPQIVFSSKEAAEKKLNGCFVPHRYCNVFIEEVPAFGMFPVGSGTVYVVLDESHPIGVYGSKRAAKCSIERLGGSDRYELYAVQYEGDGYDIRYNETK